MSLKQFFAPISILPETSLIDLWYHEDGSDKQFEKKCCYPAIPLIGQNTESGDEIEIIPIKTINPKSPVVNERSAANFERFKCEVADLLNDKNVSYKICEEVIVLDEETRSKQIETFKTITARIKENALLYADITYGTKAMPIALLSALTYADSLCHCTVKKIVYGRYLHDGSDTGTLYDVRSLFEISSMIHTMKYVSRENADRILDSLWR